MASRALWSDEEVAILETHVDRPDWLASVSAVIHGRTIAAIKVKMAKLRSNLGLRDGRRVDGGCGQDDEEERFIVDTALASQALLAAIERAGLHP
jgi:hypothetical protein